MHLTCPICWVQLQLLIIQSYSVITAKVGFIELCFFEEYEILLQECPPFDDFINQSLKSQPAVLEGAPLFSSMPTLPNSNRFELCEK